MVEEIVAQQLHIVLPVLVGLVIGILEVYFVFHDEGNSLGASLLTDAWHGATIAIIGTLIATNVPWIVTQSWFPSFLTNFLMIDALGRSLVISGLITLMLIIKMAAAKAMTRGMSGMKETFIHKIIIAATAGFSPYYIFALYPVIEPYIGWIPFM